MAEGIPDYDELKLRIQRGPQGSYAVLAFGPDGSTAEGTFSAPFTDMELDNFVLRVGLPRRSVRAYRSSQMEEAKRFGSALCEALLQGDVREVYTGARRVADERSRGLRVTLYLTGVPELMKIPWEFLYERPSFLAQSIYTPLVRSLDLKTVRPPRKMKLPLRILAMVSRPEGFETLDVDREREKLGQALEALESEGMVHLQWLERGTLEELDRTISSPDEEHVLHYIGHGAYDQRTHSGILLFEDARGGPHEVTGEELCSLLQDERSLRLAVLNSCEGARTSHVDPFSGVASSLVECGIPAVIGMQFEITDDAAITFSERLYTALAQGYPVDAALAQARKAILAAGNDIEFGTPVLFLRAAEARLFDVAERPATTSDPQPSAPAREPSPSETTYRVDAGGRGGYATIGAAIEDAVPGSTIAVAPGLYREALLVETPGLEIVGHDRPDAVVVRAPAGRPALTLSTNGTRLAGLTLRAGNGNEDDPSCVEITEGSATLENCTIVGGGKSALAVAADSWIGLYGSRVQRAALGGVFVEEDAAGEIAENDISANGGVAVHVLAGADPSVRDNKIRDGGSAGVFVAEGARGRFQANEIYANTTGIFVDADAAPEVQNNKIHHCRSFGVVVTKKARGTFEGNDIYANEKDGVYVDEGADPVVQNNTIRDGKDAGVYVTQNGRGTFAGNDIFANSHAGMFVDKGANPAVHDNRIHDGKAAGVHVAKDGRGTFEANDIFANGKAGVYVEENGDPTVRDNTIHDGKNAGVVVTKEGLGTFEANSIHGHPVPGVYVAKNGDPIVRNNEIYDGENAGVRVTANGRGTFEGNEIYANATDGIMIDDGGAPTVSGNIIRDNSESGIYAQRGAGGTAEKNRLFGNGQKALVVTSDSHLTDRGNEITEG